MCNCKQKPKPSNNAINNLNTPKITVTKNGDKVIVRR